MRRSSPWLISRTFDLWSFGAPAVVALALVPLGPWLAPTGETPVPFWVITVLVVDVAHVWSTIFRTYLDPTERDRRWRLYFGVPVLAYAVGVAAAWHGWATFWTGLAYVAVFHFVRQQYGWVALYDRLDPGVGRWERRFDVAAIYAATVFPLLWWHAHLPRQYTWFLPGDFVDGAVSLAVVRALWPVYGLALAGFVVLQVGRGLRDGPRWGKILVVGSTAACWGVGIIATDSDWAFTVTNVLIHGVPYVAFVWVQGRRDVPRYPQGHWLRAMYLAPRGVLVFAGVVVALAYVEEWAWDRLIWHGSTGLFVGPTVDLGAAWVGVVMPLLAVPQLTHYILDGFIWRRSFRSPGAAT